MTAVARKNIQMWFAAAGTNPVAVASAGTLITGQIKNYSQTGGNTDIESVPHFGGYVTKEKSQEQIEVEMEVTPAFELASADVWDSLFLSKHSTGPFTYNAAGSALALFIQATDGTNSKTRCFNNVSPSDFEVSHEADDNQTMTVKFKLSPQTSGGVANYQTKNTTIAGMTAWSSLV